MTGLTVKLLGDFSAQYNLQLLLKFRSNRVQALLIYLVETPGIIHQREALMELLWPNMLLKSAQGNLRQTTYLLNRAIPQLPEVNGMDPVPFILTDRKTIQLHPDGLINLDTAAFTDLIERARQSSDGELLGEAAALYRGDFVQNFFLSDSVPFEAWILARREAYRKEALEILEAVTKKQILEGALDVAEKVARKQIEIAPYHDIGHVQIIEILALGGRRSEALAHFDRYAELLDRELSLKPTPKARLLQEQIVKGQFEQSLLNPEAEIQMKVEGNFASKENDSEITRDSTQGEEIPIRHNLPVEISPFIGRKEEQVSLLSLLNEPESRLVTILGAGGMGKTRLAVSTAYQLHSKMRFTDGVFFVDLAPLNDPNRIIDSAAEALEFQMEGSSGREPKQQLLDYLRKKSLFLVMDNFEQLREGASLLIEMIEKAPGIKLLVTSRERLNLKAERLFPLGGFRRVNYETIDEAFDSPAVELFVSAARRVRPDFVLWEEDLLNLTSIIDQVEGMPLAIELAAGWVDMLSIEDIAAEIQSDLAFLETEVGDVPERHRSVRAAFSYSWKRLSAEEQDIFSRLSVFRGGFTRQAAGEIAQASLKELSRLANKSFLKFNPSSHRYKVHELMRQFGAEYLARNENLEHKVGEQHCLYYSDYLQVLGDELNGRGQLKALEKIRIDLDNGRVAWDWAIENRDFDNLIKTHYVWYELLYKWDTRYDEVQELILRILAAAADSSSEVARQIEFFTRVLSCELYGRLDNHQKMDQASQQALDLLAEPPLSKIRIWPGRYFAQALLSNYLKDRQKGFELCRECVSFFRETEDHFGLAVSLFELSVFYDRRGDIETRKSLLEESLQLCQSIGNIIYSGAARMELAWVAHEMGQFEKAKELAEEVLDEAKKINRHYGIASCYRILGWNGLLNGDFAAAYQAYQASLELYESYGYEYQVGQARYDLGQTALHRGDLRKARYWLESVPVDLLKQKSDLIPAITKALLGQLALVEGKQQQSMLLHRESIDLLLPFADELWWYPQFLTLYAICLINGGVLNEAEKLIEESLARTSKDPRWHSGLILTGVAMLLSTQGKIEQAVEIYAAASFHPHVGKSRWYRDVVGKFIEQRAETLPREMVEAARGQGKKENLGELQSAIETLAGQFNP